MKHFFFTGLGSILYLVLMTACTSPNNRKIDKKIGELSDIRDVHIQPDEHLSLNTKDFIDSLQFIPLETTNESQFGEISQIETVGDLYVILDKVSNQILFFKKNGNYVSKINSNNQDIPIPFKSIYKFTIDFERQVLSFPDLQSSLIYEFDFAGNFVKIQEKELVDYKIHESCYLNNHRIDYFSFEDALLDKTESPGVTISENGQKTASYLFFDPSIIDSKDVYSASKYFFKSNEQLLFSRPYDYTIYSFGRKGEMTGYLHISLPEELCIPSDFLTNNKYTDKRRAYTNTHKSTIYLITDVYKIGDMLSFKLMGSKYANTFLYDLNRDALIDFRKYLSDSSTHFLPIAGNNVLGVDNSSYISSIPSKRLIQALTANIKIEGYLSSLPDRLREFYKLGNNQNPVLVLTRLKKAITYETKG